VAVSEVPLTPIPGEGGGSPGAPDRRAVRPRSDTTRVVSADISLRRRLDDIWQRRELLVNMVRTEISVKYKNSVLGLFWSLLNPLLNLAVYFLVFQIILGEDMPKFVVFLFSGLLVWNLFQTGVQTATSVVVSNAGLVKKVSFPREILALAAQGSALYFFVFQCLVMVVFLLVMRNMPDWNYLPLLVLALLAALVFCAALGVLLSAVNVYLRDTQHLVDVLMTAWFWACPIVYGFQEQIAPKLKSFTWVYFLNPLTPLVLTFQRTLYAHVSAASTATPAPGQPPTILHILPPHGMAWYGALDGGVLVLSAALFLVALKVFGRLEGNFAEEL